MPEYYEIKIKAIWIHTGRIGLRGLKLTHLEGNETLLSGSLPDQAALPRLLERLRDLNLRLISLPVAVRPPALIGRSLRPNQVPRRTS